MTKHETKKAEAIAILEHALTESRAGRSYDYFTTLKALGFEHTYRSYHGRQIWEPAELTADTKAKGSKRILSVRFFTLYESEDPEAPWLNFICGRIGNTGNYFLATDE